MAVYEDSYKNRLKGFTARQKEMAEENERRRKEEESNNAYKKFMGDDAAAVAAATKPDDGKQWWEMAGDTALDIGKSIVGIGQRIGGTAAQAGVGLFGAADTAVSLAQGKKDEAQKKSNKYTDVMENIAEARAIDDGSMSFISDDIAKGKADVGEFGAGFTKAGADVAGFVAPAAKAGSILKTMGASAGIEGTVATGASAADQYAREGEVDMGEALKAGAAGAVLGGGMSGVGSLMRKGTDAPAPVEKTDIPTTPGTRVDLTDPDIPQQLKERALSNGTGFVPDGKTIEQVDQAALQLPATRQSSEELGKQLTDLTTGNYSDDLFDVNPETGQSVLNPQRLTERFKAVRDEYTIAKNQEIADQNFIRENTFAGSGKAPEQLNKELEAARNGVVPDNVKVERPDFEDALDVAEAMPQLAPQVNDLVARRRDVMARLDQTLTPQKAEQAKAQIDMKYESQRANLEGLPDLRRKYETARIDEQYSNELATIDEELASVGDAADELQAELDLINREEQDLVLRANFVKSNNPENFRVVDAQKQADYIVELEKDKVVAETFPDPDDASSVITNTMVRTDSPEQFKARIDNDAAVKKAYDQKMESAMQLTVRTEKPGMNFLSTPIATLERWGERGKFMAGELLDAHFNFARARGQFSEKVRDWHEALDGVGKESSTKVFRSLDGEDVQLDPAEQAIRTEIRGYLDEMATKLGITDKSKISEYIPHMFEQSFGKRYTDLEKVVAKIRYGVDEAGKKIDADEKAALAKQLGDIDAETLAFIRSNTSWKVKNGFLEQRTGAKGYSQDLFKVLSSYDNIANKKIHYEPAMQTVNALSKDLSTEQKVYLDKFFARIKGDHSSPFEDTMDRFVGEGNTAKLLSGQRRLSNASVMGASPLTWVKNMQDTAKVFADRPLKHVVAAIPEAVAAMRYGSPANRELFRNGIMESNMAQFLKGMTDEMDVSKTGKAKGALLKGEQLLWSGMRAVDAFTRSLNYRASINEFMEANPGAKMDDAIKFAQKTNRDTVFTFSDIDVPVAMNNAIGRSTLNMQTYNLQTAKYIMQKFGKDMVEKGSDGKYRLSGPGFFKLSKYVAANMAFMGTVGAGLGLKPHELVPFGNEFAQGQLPQSPIISQLMGNDFQEGLVPTAGNTMQELFKTVFQGDSSGLAEAAGKSGEATMDFATSMIPGKTQFERTTKGIESYANGYATSGSGNIQFKQNDDALNAAMAAVFGKNTTEAGKEWKDRGMQTLSPEQMRLGESVDSGVTINNLPPEEKERYVRFYSAVNQANPYDFDSRKTKRDEVLEDARKAAREGNANRVRKLIVDYNKKAAIPLQEFQKAYGQNLPGPMIQDINAIFIEDEDLVPQGYK